MAGTLAITRPLHRQPSQALSGGLAVLHGTWTFAAYATGGVAVSLAPPAQGVLAVLAHPTGGYVFEYVIATGKLKAYAPGGAEVGNGTDLSGLGAIPFVAFVNHQFGGA